MSSSSADTGEKIQIVIADDHPIVREGLTAILGLQKDFQIVGQAEDGEQACQLCHQFSPDILILDLRMPGMDGLQLQRLLASRSYQIPIIFVTAHGSDQDEREAMKAGAVGFLRKPVSKEALLKAIQTALMHATLRE